MSNLLSNAVQHGARGGPIIIEGSVRGGGITLSFFNSGKPICQEQMDLLFKPFTRAQGDKKSEGLGLGLYICSQIAASHGGDLRVRSDDMNTVFTVRLPVI